MANSQFHCESKDAIPSLKFVSVGCDFAHRGSHLHEFKALAYSDNMRALCAGNGYVGSSSTN